MIDAQRARRVGEANVNPAPSSGAKLTCVRAGGGLVSELAINYKNRRFQVDPRTRAWLVERLRDGQRGQLDAVVDDDGAPLTPSIDIRRSDFRTLVKGQAGRYRLTQLGADMMPVDGAEHAYAIVPPAEPVRCVDESDAEPVGFDGVPLVSASPLVPTGMRNAAPSDGMVTAPNGAWPALPMPREMSGVEYLLAEALRGQVVVNLQQGQTNVQQLERITNVLATSVAAVPALIEAATAKSERLESLLGQLLLHKHGVPASAPPSPPSPTPPSGPTPPAPQPPAPTFVYAMPRNASFFDETYDDDGQADDDTADAPIEAKGEEDMLDKINRLVEKVATALAPVASVAQMVMGAGLGRGMFGGGDDRPRNAAGDAPAGEPENDNEPAEPALGHLRTSHVLAISHELGAEDGSIFRTMIRAMEPADRRMFVDRLCSMPIDEAVPYAAEKVAWMKARVARSRARCADAAPPTYGDVIDVEPADPNPDQEHDITQHDDAADRDDINPDQEHDTTQHDHADDEPTHPDDQEHERDSHLDNLADTNVPDSAEAREDTDASEADTDVPTPNDDANRSPMSTALATTTATASEVPRPVTPDVTAHMKRIAKHLKFTEILQAQQLINSTSIAERNAWIERLMALDPSEAATVVRAELARRAGR